MLRFNIMLVENNEKIQKNTFIFRNQKWGELVSEKGDKRRIEILTLGMVS